MVYRTRDLWNLRNMSITHPYRRYIHVCTCFCQQLYILWSDRLPRPVVQWVSESWRLTHWGRVTHICVSKFTIIGSYNGLSPGRRQAIIWTNAAISSIGPLGTHFSGLDIEIYTFSFKKMQLKMSSGKWWPFCFGFNVLSVDRLLNSPILVTVGLSVPHGTWPPTGWCHRFCDWLV